MTWDLIGEDAEAIAADGTLPLDWRTKAKGLRAWANEVGDYVDVKRLRDATVCHAFRCWAPPGEWYGGWWITWHRRNADGGGWIELDDEHTWCTGNEDIAEGECAGHNDVLCLGFDPLDRDTEHINAAIGMALAYAPPSVHIVCAGEGWPWYSRKIADVTVVGIG